MNLSRGLWLNKASRAARASSGVTTPSPLVSARKKKPPASKFPASMASFWEIRLSLLVSASLKRNLPTSCKSSILRMGPGKSLSLARAPQASSSAQQSGPDGDLANLFATHEMILLVLFRNLDQSPDQPNRTVQVA